ncbi:NADH-ubiquinone oxidoreductase-F iron-sulfur binding region domain-containing protein [Yunchengibacter salinarum]|uniref:NADH-ubiquinone oxidoreductase-F iron-sulfur binding region domain-containing protein n=1 Tax=Yunchengibacter salinarum TaxID=3133399 RepID=UPI0035B63441
MTRNTTQEAPVRVYVPRETAALSVGAEETARALMAAARSRGIRLDLIRTGGRGAHWLEPLVETDGPNGQPEERLAYGPLTAMDADSALDHMLGLAHDHDRFLGPVADIPYFRVQDRLTFRRAGVTDPLSLADYEAHGGLKGLKAALAMDGGDVVEELVTSGLRGRGGAAFPTGIKWRTVREAEGARKFIVCNADEGDSGTFADRMIFEADPFLLIEGMAIAAHAVGAGAGYVYLRSEYPLARDVFRDALDRARKAGLLGPDALGLGRPFDITLRMGAGAYICGEETAMLDSLEGKRGQVRVKPPLPAIEGLFGAPTVVNNVLSLAAVPDILAEGGAAYQARGINRSRGTTAFQLAGNIRRGGLVEAPFGMSLKTLIEDVGGGTLSGRPIGAVQVGGPLGAYVPPHKLDTPLGYEELADIGGMMGHGGIVVFDDRVDLAAQARFAMEFCALESCGKCTPCRIGAVRGLEAIDRMIADGATEDGRADLKDLCTLMRDGSLCAMGGLTPTPVTSILDGFPDAFAGPHPDSGRPTP